MLIVKSIATSTLATATVITSATLIARGVERAVGAGGAWHTARDAHAGEGGRDVACVPVFDLCNHAPTAERGLQLRFDCGRYRVVCSAKAPIGAGEEILYHYGGEHPEDFLQNYGFTPCGL